MQVVEIVSCPTCSTVEMIDTEQELVDRNLMMGQFGHAAYTPFDPNCECTDSFTYRVQDNKGVRSNVATASFSVQSAPPVPDNNGVMVSGSGHTGADIGDFVLTGDFALEFVASFTACQTINNADAVFGAGLARNAGANDMNVHAGSLRLYSFDDGGDQVVSE